MLSGIKVRGRPLVPSVSFELARAPGPEEARGPEKDPESQKRPEEARKGWEEAKEDARWDCLVGSTPRRENFSRLDQGAAALADPKL